MAAPDDQRFEIAPTRVGGQQAPGEPGRSGRGRLRIILVVLAALSVPAVAFAGPRIEWRPEIDVSVLRPTPTAVPSPTLRPTETPVPTATPLPPVTIAAGPLPSDPLPIDVTGLRLIDPSTGALGPVADVRLNNDAVFREVGGDGWWCVCFAHESLVDSETVAVTVRHLDRNLGEIKKFAIATYKSVGSPASQDFSIRFDLERSVDGRIAYLAVGARNLDRWTIHVDVIDLEHGLLLGTAKLVTIKLPQLAEPAPSSGGDLVESYLGGPTIRLSPDDRQLFVFAFLDSSAVNGKTTRYAWFVDVAGDSSTQPIGKVHPLQGGLLDQFESCGLLTWLGPDDLAMTCWDAFGVSSRPKISIRTIDVAGRQTGGASFELDEQAQLAEPLIDTANRLVYFWEPDSHILHRLDLQRGSSDQLVVDPSSVRIPRPVPAVGPTPDRLPVWATGYSDFSLYSSPRLTAAPGVARIYAVGVTASATALANPDWRFGSTGIWVFDTSAFSLVDQWPAAAAYTSIALSPDGRWLTAVGQGGIDVGGNEAGWEWSVSIHDTVDGRVALQLGRLGESGVLTMP